jgi:hypothetical protein
MTLSNFFAAQSNEYGIQDIAGRYFADNRVDAAR